MVSYIYQSKLLLVDQRCSQQVLPQPRYYLQITPEVEQRHHQDHVSRYWFLHFQLQRGTPAKSHEIG